ncbi:MAG: ABC transporter permease [Janthinobacterium lividum]
MAKHLLWKFGSTLLTLLAMTLLIFVTVRLIGDPAHTLLPPEATPADRMVLRHELGLDRPLLTQYLIYLWHLLHGDVGRSFLTNQSAFASLLPEIWPSVLLSGAALLVSVALGLPWGAVAALRPHGVLAGSASVFEMFGLAAPPFLVGLLLIRFFSVQLHWLPTGGFGTLQNLLMPAFALSLYTAAALLRLTRATMQKTLASDYVRFARLKGVPERVLVFRHALKNAALPIVTFAASQFGTLIAGAVSIELVFSWPGIGKSMVDAISQLDFPVVQAAAIVIVLIFVTTNFLTDLLYVWLDPRIRFSA